jgi:dTDP-4-dehydrorhamnose reductase
MPDDKRILYTGGNGLLGSEFKKIRADIQYTDYEDFNVLDYEQMTAYVQGKPYQLIIHAAAFTSPPQIDKDPLTALQVNIVGTANVVRLCMAHDMRMIYICTDYVFKGDRGNYKETDPVYPVNKYAWSKLGGECAVRLYDKALIIRTTFGPNVFPYEKAFTDQWTSRQSVATIARKISALADKDVTGVVHVGGPRRTVYEYAASLDPDRQIGRLSVHDVNFAVPADTSLNCEKYDRIVNE